MYQEGPLTRLVEFSLVDKTQQPSKTWLFGGFYPLTSQDVLEQRKIHGITTGIPIADDMDKASISSLATERSCFVQPGSNPTETEVAPSAEALSHFEIADEEA